MHDIETLATESVERELPRNPRRQAEDAGRRVVPGDTDRDGTAHRKADQQRVLRPVRVSEIECRGGIGHARVELLPRLHPVPHLDEADAGEARRELDGEQLTRRAPRSRNVLRGATVDEDRPQRGALVPDPRLRAAGKLPYPRGDHRPTPAAWHERIAATTAAARAAYPAGLPWMPSKASQSGCFSTIADHSTRRTFRFREAAARSTALNAS